MFHSTSPVWHGIEACKKMPKAEIRHLEKKEGKTLKRIFNLSITAPYIGLIIETRVLQNFEGQIWDKSKTLLGVEVGVLRNISSTLLGFFLK